MTLTNLACDAEMSARHLGLLETGKAQPSRQMLLHLADCLGLPMREKNALLSAAGLDPLYQEHAFDAPALDIIRHSVEMLLAAHDPHPALVIDRHWTMLSANRAVAHLVAGAELTLLRPPVNVIRLFLHPAGLAPRIINLAQWREHVMSRLRQQIDCANDSTLMDLLEEVRDYPCSRSRNAQQPDSDGVAIPFRLATIDGVLSFLWATTRFDTPIDITVSELAIEAFLPSDDETDRVMRRVAQRENTRVSAASSLAVPA